MTVRQATFGFAAGELPAVSRARDPETSKVAERDLNRSGRRPTQIDALLGRLRLGPATNRELVGIAINYRARVSDARSLGHVIEVEPADGGLTVYRLTHDAGDVREPNR